jgi:hypothetical protein
MNFSEIKLPNSGVLLYDVPEELMEKVREQTDKIYSLPQHQHKLINYKNKLVGQIEKELKFQPNTDLRNYINDMAKKYLEYFEITGLPRNPTLDSMWVNYQKAGEYNPSHFHTGYLSFVIWVKIPYKLEEEDVLPNAANASEKVNGRFAFVYNTYWNSPQIHVLNVDKSYEGKCIMFPCTAIHSVNPFYTSNDTRISLAGNLRI